MSYRPVIKRHNLVSSFSTCRSVKQFHKRKIYQKKNIKQLHKKSSQIIECQHKIFVLLLIICSFLHTLPQLRICRNAKIRKSQIGKTCRSSRRCWDHQDYSEYHAAPAICKSLYLYCIAFGQLEIKQRFRDLSGPSPLSTGCPKKKFII